MPVAPGSFRDPQGEVLITARGVFRALRAPLAPFEETWNESGPLAEFVASGTLWPAKPLRRDEVPAEVLSAAPDAVGFLEHPLFAPITYPYEWPFRLLKRAALLHLRLHRAVLARGLNVADGSAFNVQFSGVQPVFIDALAFVPYVEGQPWAGYAQFCETFLNPLLLASRGDSTVLDTYRGALRGIPTREAARQLGWFGSLRAGVFTHVFLHAMAGRATNGAASAQRPKLTRAGLDLLLASLARAITRLEPPPAQRSGWSGYASDNSYSEQQRNAKHAAVSDFIARTRPALLLDLGCNTGEYAKLALGAGAQRVVGLERDGDAVNQAVIVADSLDKPFLPLQVDVQNMSPSQGWDLSERVSLIERVKPDASLCLALLHHLVLGEGLPLERVVRSIVSMAPSGVIEFVPPEDPMARRLAGPPERLTHRYDLPTFLASLRAVARIEKQWPLTDAGRLLVEYRR